MGDSESCVPPSKKRIAETEISKDDDPGLDDEDGDGEWDTATFKRANAEVMAGRRTVRRVRRISSPASVPNPFTGIQLAPPVRPVASSTDDDSLKPKQDAGSNPEEADDSLTAQKEEDEAALQESVAAAESNSNPKEEAGEIDDANAEKAHSLSSFRQLSRSRNAFSGLAGTGVSMANVPCDPSTPPGSAPNFKFPTNGSSSSLSYKLGPQIIPNSSRESGLPVLEVPLETGEEDETAVFSSEATLFEFIAGSWRERGRGQLKVNASSTGPDPKKARLLMRTRGNLRLILNASLYPDMKVTDMDRCGITFACLNASSPSRNSGPHSPALSTFALRFKEEELKQKFTSVVMEHKGSTSSSSPRLRSPEISPRGDVDNDDGDVDNDDGDVGGC